MEIHDVVVRVKEWVAEHGRVPTKGEFCRDCGLAGIYNWFIRNGSWTDVLHAAGLPTYGDRKARGEMSLRLTNQIFARDIPAVLAEHKPRPPVIAPVWPRVLIIPDTHFPWPNQRVLEGAYRFAEGFQPEIVVQLGDLYDMYGHAKFPKSMNIYKPQEEEELSRKGAETMWLELQKAAPKAKCIQLKGNHDIRPLKRTLEGQPQLEHVVARHLDKLMTFPNVELIADHRQEYVVGNVEFLHGYKSQLGAHRDHALMNAVCGHIHVGGVVYRQIRGQTLWELNAGLAGDPEAKALSYTSQKISNWTPGFGAIDEHGPRFIPVG